MYTTYKLGCSDVSSGNHERAYKHFLRAYQKVQGDTKSEMRDKVSLHMPISFKRYTFYDDD